MRKVFGIIQFIAFVALSSSCFKSSKSQLVTNISFGDVSVHRTIDSVVSDMAAQLKVHGTGKLTSATMAILPPVNANGQVSLLGDTIAGTLQQKMFDPAKWSLLERERIDSMLSEMELSQSGMVEDKSDGTQKLAADVLLVGSIRDLGNRYQIDLRIVIQESGIVTATANGYLYASATIARKYSEKKESSSE